MSLKFARKTSGLIQKEEKKERTVFSYVYRIDLGNLDVHLFCLSLIYLEVFIRFYFLVLMDKYRRCRCPHCSRLSEGRSFIFLGGFSRWRSLYLPRRTFFWIGFFFVLLIDDTPKVRCCLHYQISVIFLLLFLRGFLLLVNFYFVMQWV